MIKNDEQINNSNKYNKRRKLIIGQGKGCTKYNIYISLIVVVNKYEIMRKRKSEKIWYSLIKFSPFIGNDTTPLRTYRYSQ